MNASSSKRSKVAAFLAVVVVSAATMIVLFWLFPLTTAIVTLAMFALLGMAARFARSLDVGDISEVERG